MTDALVFLMEYGAIVLFAVVFLEQIGLPIPAIPILIAAGALVGTGHLSLWATIGSTVVAALAADWIWYDLGRRRGRPVLGWLCRIALEPDSCIRKTEAFFVKHGPHSLVLAKFLPGLSTIAPPLAGIVGLGVPLFLFYDTLGAVVWTGASVGIGYVFADQLEDAFRYADQMTPVALLIMAFATLLYVAYKAVHRRRQLRNVPRITVKELTEKLKTDVPPLIIDVRPSALGAMEARIPGAIHMPLDDLGRRHFELPWDRELVLYCDCPGDVASAQGALLLGRLGFTSVRPLRGGIEAWQAYHGAAVTVEKLWTHNDDPFHGEREVQVVNL